MPDKLNEELFEETLRLANEMDKSYDKLSKKISKPSAEPLRGSLGVCKKSRYQQISKIFMSNLLDLMRDVHEEKGSVINKIKIAFGRAIENFNKSLKNAASEIRAFYNKLNIFDKLLFVALLTNKHVFAFGRSVLKEVWWLIEKLSSLINSGVGWVVNKILESPGVGAFINVVAEASKRIIGLFDWVISFFDKNVSLSEEILESLNFGKSFISLLWEGAWGVITNQIKAFFGSEKEEVRERDVKTIVSSKENLWLVFSEERTASYRMKYVTDINGFTKKVWNLTSVDTTISQPSVLRYQDKLLDKSSSTLQNSTVTFVAALRRTRSEERTRDGKNERLRELTIKRTEKIHLMKDRAMMEAIVSNVPVFKLDDDFYETEVTDVIKSFKGDILPSRIKETMTLFWAGLWYALAPSKLKDLIFKQYLDNKWSLHKGVTQKTKYSETKKEIEKKESELEVEISSNQQLDIVQQEVKNNVIFHGLREGMNKREKDAANSIKDDFLSFLSKIRKSFIDVEIEVPEPVHSS